MEKPVGWSRDLVLGLLGGLGVLALAPARTRAAPPDEPRTLAPNVGQEQLLSDLQAPPHKVTLPAQLEGKDVYWGLYKICVDKAGNVADVKVIRSAYQPQSQPLSAPISDAAKGLDARWIATMKTWRYRPYAIDGTPVPFCHTMRLQIGEATRDPAKPAMLAPSVGRGQLLTDINSPPHRPSLPPELNRPGNQVWGLYKICVSTSGEVTNVKTLKSADTDELDSRWMLQMKGWRYKPYVLEDQPVPFCYSLRLQVNAR